MAKEIQPHDLVEIYHNARHARFNSWVFSLLATVSAIAGFGFFISDLPVRLQLSLTVWCSSLVLVNRAATASKDADKYGRRVTALEQFSEESFIHSLAQSVRPGLEPVQLSAQLETTGSPEADAVLQCLSDYEIESRFERAIRGPSFTRLFLKPARGQKVNQIFNLGQELQLALGLENPPLLSVKPSGIAIDIPNAQRSILKFSQFMQFEERSPLEPLLLAVGVDLEGRLIELDLSDPNTCHVLGGGTTGSGKSEFLRTGVLSLIGGYSPQSVKVAIADPKRVTFNDFEGMPWQHCPVAKDADSIALMLSGLTAEMDRRYELLEEFGVADLAAYNMASPKPLPRIVVLIDEYGELLDQCNDEQSGIVQKSVRRLAQKARAAGIHLLLFTQRPDAKKLDPQLRSNLPASIGLKVQRLEESTIIMGTPNSGAENLLGKGDLLLRAGNEVARLQAPLVDSPILVRQAIARCNAASLPAPTDVTLAEVQEDFKLADPRQLLENCLNLSVDDVPQLEQETTPKTPEIDWDELPDHLHDLIKYSLKYGWVTARKVKAGVRLYSGSSTEEIRSFFLAATNAGVGMTRGEGDRLQYAAILGETREYC